MRDPVTGLTDRQLRFAVEYQVDHNATQAAIRAGYSPNGAAQRGLELLRNSKIEKIVAVQETARLESVLGSADWIVQQAAETVLEARETGQLSVVAPNLALLAKRHPEFRDGGVNVNVTGDKVLILDRLREIDGSAGR